MELAVFELVLFGAVEFFGLVVGVEAFAVVLGCAGAVVLAVAGLVAAASPAEVWPAAVAGRLADIASTHTAAQLATKRALRISAQVLNKKTFASRKTLWAGTPNNKRPNERWHCNHPR